jgi:phosphate-selective porin OprO/OprP
MVLAAGLPPATASADDSVTAVLKGQLQFDIVAEASSNLPPGPRLSTGGTFRRIRLGVAGRLGSDWSYELTPRLEAARNLGGIPVTNAFVQYDGFKPVHLKVGAQAAPSNFEDATSSNDLLFLERAQPADLARSIGAGTGRSAATLFAYDESYFAALSLTGGLPAEGVFRQKAVVGRLVWRPLHGADGNLAVGADMTHVFALPATGTAHDVRLRQRPEMNEQTVDLRLVDTGTLDSAGVTEFGLEAAGDRGGFYGQGGVFHYAIDRAGPGASDPIFRGWYLQASVILTGESRPWRANRGGYGAPAPAHPTDQGGPGALEIAARFSELDLNDAAGLAATPLAPGAVRGGRQDIATLGLNWYPQDMLRLMLDYQHVSVARLDGAGGPLDASADLVSLRSQFSF